MPFDSLKGVLKLVKSATSTWIQSSENDEVTVRKSTSLLQLLPLCIHSVSILSLGWLHDDKVSVGAPALGHNRGTS